VAADNRDVAIGITLGYEGGYTNHPRDPGGPTNWGITIHDARMYWRPNATAEDVKAMPRSVAIEIYRQKYWAKMHCDERPAGVDLVDFDLGVNSGTARTEQFRRALDPLKLSPVDYVKRQCAKRLAFLQGLRTWGTFGKGWGSRVANVEARGVKMALAAAGKPCKPALQKEGAKAAKKSIGHATAGASTTAGSSGATHSLPDLSGIDLTHKAGLIVFCALVVLGIGWFVWHAVHNAHRANAYAAVAKEP
jgi:lysozyme family protein